MDHIGVGLTGRTLAMLGIGNIGAEAVRLLKPFDLRIIAHDPYVDPAKLEPLGVRPVPLEQAFREADILAVCCSLTRETHHLVSRERLALMKPTAFVVNIARGPIVDQDALVAALKAGKLAGAGLDVLEREPPAPDEAIFALDNVILSPHTLGTTDECMHDIFAESVAAALDVMHGREPHTIVNRDVLDNAAWRRKLAGYRERFGS
jgi:phosphoglycerate dehydrogenase-like enzyme